MKRLSSLAGRAAGAKLVPACLIAFFCLSRPCAGQTYNGFNYSVSGNNITITGYTGLGGAVTIPLAIPGVSGTVTSIGAIAFDDSSSLTSVIIPDGVTSIGARAFRWCSGLTNVMIPNSVTSIGGGAFDLCGLTSVTIPNGVPSIGAETFEGCSALTNVTIPKSVTSIGDWAFEGCSALTSVTIPDNVTSIGEDTFYGCSGLTSVTIPDSVTSIGAYAFKQCSGLTNASFQGDAPASFGFEVFDGDAAGFTIYYPANATGFATPTWNGYPALPYSGSLLGSLQVTLAPAGAVSSGAQWQVDGGAWQSSGATVSGLAAGSHTVAFSTVSGWITPSSQTVTIIADNTATTSGTYIQGGFSFTVNGTAITITGYSGPGDVLAIPSTLPGVNGTVTAIGQAAFQGFSSLTSVIIPDGVTSIGEGAFYGCSGLRSMTIPSSVTTIGADAFEGCSDLTSVTIPNSVTSIGDNAFNGCSSLTSVTIPNSVTSIGKGTFY